MTTYTARVAAPAHCADGFLDRTRLMRRVLAPLAASLLLAACSIQKIATHALSETLISGDSIFESDDDPVLIGEALPLALKMIEALSAEQPRNAGLLLAAARGYTLYTYVTVGLEEERVRLEDIDAARALRARARRLYLRAHEYAIRALEIDTPGIAAELRSAPERAAATLGAGGRADIDAIYWSAATLGLAISSARTDPTLLARLPEVEALLARALAIDESWQAGTLHEFAISLAAANPAGADKEALAEHYRRALELSDGNRASLFVAYAEAVALPEQDRAGFEALLERALAVDLDRDPAHRLLNVIAQQRATMLLARVEQLFL